VCGLSIATSTAYLQISYIEDDPLRKWIDDRDFYLQEFIRLDGRGDLAVGNACRLCGLTSPDIRCEDCFGGELLCRKCVIDRHASNPLHRIEVHTASASTVFLLIIDNSAGMELFSS
jgi:hypothetical protein